MHRMVLNLFSYALEGTRKKTILIFFNLHICSVKSWFLCDVMQMHIQIDHSQSAHTEKSICNTDRTLFLDVWTPNIGTRMFEHSLDELLYLRQIFANVYTWNPHLHTCNPISNLTIGFINPPPSLQPPPPPPSLPPPQDSSKKSSSPATGGPPQLVWFFHWVSRRVGICPRC